MKGVLAPSPAPSSSENRPVYQSLGTTRKRTYIFFAKYVSARTKSPQAGLSSKYGRAKPAVSDMVKTSRMRPSSKKSPRLHKLSCTVDVHS